LNDALSSLINSLAEFPKEFEDWQPSNVFSVADTIARIGTVGGLMDSLTTLAPEKFALVPAARITGVATAYSNLVQSVERAKAQFDQMPNWGGFGRFDAPSGQIVAQNGNAVSAKSIFDDIAASVDNVLEAHIPIVATTQPRSVGTFVAAARELRKQAADATRLVAELTKQQASLTTTIAQTVAEENKAVEAATEAARLAADVEQTRKTVDDHSIKVAALLASVESIGKKAEDLEADVDAYETTFKGFQSALNAREAALEKGNSELNSVVAALKTNQEKIEQQIAKADQMLGGATVAGLSSTYQTQSQNVDGQMWWARATYYAAIAFMALSVAFSLNVFGEHMPPVIPTESQEAGPLAIRVFAALGSRALVLLPSILLLTFASRQHSALFKLREQYSHKYNIAASVHGFKAQAPEYEQPIAGAVFLELLKNPTSSLDAESSEKSNEFVADIIAPAVQKAMEQLRRKADDKPE
jgi:hypothetical protein